MLLIRRLGYLLLVTCYCDRCRPIVALVYNKLVPVIAAWSQLLAPWSLVRYSCPWDSGEDIRLRSPATMQSEHFAGIWSSIEVYLQIFTSP